MTRTDILRALTSLGVLLIIAMLGAERRILRTLRRANATGPRSAAVLPRGTFLARLRLARLRTAGVVIATSPGRFYLSEAGYAAHRRSRRRRALMILAAGIGVIAFLWWNLRT